MPSIIPKKHPAILLLKGLVGPTTLSRGIDLAQSDGVPAIEELNDGAMTAWIQGTHSEPYAVRVWAGLAGEKPRGACTCPVGLSREFCKHQVALWAVWQTGVVSGASNAIVQEKNEAIRGDESLTGLAEQSKVGGTVAIKKAKLTPLALLESRVANADVGALRAWVMALAHESKPAMQQLLALSTQTQGAEALSANEVKTTVNGLLGRHRFLDYRDSTRYANSIEPVLALYDRLLADGQFEVVLATLAPAILKLDRQLSEADDSNGSIGSVLYELCHRWWRAAGGEVSALKMQKIAQQWLAMYLEMNFPDGLTHCLEVPMEKLPVLQVQLIQLIASKVAAIPMPEKHRYGWKSLQQSFAHWLGDADTWIALERDSEYCNSAGIMQTLHDVKRDREAIQVGELSLRSLDKNDVRCRAQVRQLLGQLYAADGFKDEAIEQIWLNFKDHPTLIHYRHLQAMALLIDGADGAATQGWTDKALALSLALCRASPKVGENSQFSPQAKPRTDYSAYFELILVDGHYQAAYELLGEDGACSQSQYQLIGAWRIKHNALDGFKFTVKLCQDAMADHFVNRKHYETVYALLAKAAPYMGADAASKAAYRTHIEEMKTRYRLKKSFIPMLNDAMRLV